MFQTCFKHVVLRCPNIFKHPSNTFQTQTCLEVFESVSNLLKMDFCDVQQINIRVCVVCAEIPSKCRNENRPLGAPCTDEHGNLCESLCDQRTLGEIIFCSSVTKVCG